MFGSMQMAVSRVIKLQHHRIAQVLAMVLEAGGTWETFGEAGFGPGAWRYLLRPEPLLTHLLGS